LGRLEQDIPGGLKSGHRERHMDFEDIADIFLTYLVFLSPQFGILYVWAFETCSVANCLVGNNIVLHSEGLALVLLLLISFMTIANYFISFL
jgi:hypothetical protein